jgi:hypothetical protein
VSGSDENSSNDSSERQYIIFYNEDSVNMLCLFFPCVPWYSASNERRRRKGEERHFELWQKPESNVPCHDDIYFLTEMAKEGSMQ